MENAAHPGTLLAAEALEVGYGGAPVCAPVDLDLAPGSALGLIGANGAGKSTLLQSLVGLLAPLAGQVTFAGQPVDERRADFRRAVATVLDDDAFFPSLTGREHLLLTARGHGVREAETVVAALSRAEELRETIGMSRVVVVMSRPGLWRKEWGELV